MAFTIKQGALLPTYVIQLKELLGTEFERIVPNLDSVTDFKFLMRHPDAVVESDPDIQADAHYWEDPENPEQYTASVEYVWLDGDTDVIPGDYNVEVWVGWVDGKYEKFPNEGYFDCKITPDLTLTTFGMPG